MRNLASPVAAGRRRSGPGQERPRPALLAEQVRFALALAAGKGSGAAGRLLNVRRRNELSRCHCPAHRPARAAEGRRGEQGPQGRDHREQRQDDDLPDAGRARAGGRHQRRPEPVRVEPAPGGDLGCRAGSQPAGQDGRPAASAGSRRGDDAAGGAGGGAGHGPRHQRLPRPAGPVRRAVLDGANAGGRHRGTACARQRGSQRRRPAGGELRPARPGPPPVLRSARGRRRRGDSRARRGLDPLRALPARPYVPPGVPVASRGLRVPRMRKQAAGPGHRGHQDAGVARTAAPT